VAISARAGIAQQVPNSSGTELAKLKAPAGACDCHHHIYDAVRFPPIQPGGEIVPNARVEKSGILQKRIGTSRNVVVTAVRLSTRHGQVVNVPYTQECTDVAMIAVQHHRALEYRDRAINQFDLSGCEGLGASDGASI
jgi:hypothetical protein